MTTNAAAAEAMSRLEDEHDEIDEAMEDLLIFPSEVIFRRSLKLIEAHFTNEDAVMKECGFGPGNDYYDLQMSDQRRILDMATTALKRGGSESSYCNTK
eukprot:CAMPEP_0172500836 /NCGR_PEP_ID=MMETSP1066-20121228/143681_1 /TAXON_ID=671091 /ORGANISM="Coscinodiscus wailesii, Strain CCMP2513" /LENGTH=98 /DNA_ID=CAMNT_0013275307 /DNA_START=54 /DNA_END=350 /DNA_ORIENTATION=+